jgi:hypothetical protein
MQVQEGEEATYMITALNGRCIATFEDPALAAEWLEAREGNGVSYRLFVRGTHTRELYDADSPRRVTSAPT